MKIVASLPNLKDPVLCNLRDRLRRTVVQRNEARFLPATSHGRAQGALRAPDIPPFHVFARRTWQDTVPAAGLSNPRAGQRYTVASPEIPADPALPVYGPHGKRQRLA